MIGRQVPAREPECSSLIERSSLIPGVPTQVGVADVIEVELRDPLPTLATGRLPHVMLLARLCGEPVGMLFKPRAEIATPAALAAAIDTELESELIAVRVRHGLSSGTHLTVDGLPHAECPYRDEMSKAATDGPPISVVIPTRNGEETLDRTLRSVLNSRYHDFEVVVADNDSATDATARLCGEIIASGADQSRLRYVSEPKAGVSNARNACLRAARHDLIAYVDDDERVDEWWLAAIGREFSSDPRVGLVSGVILPLELETEAQVRFERYGGHSKGRGFERTVFDREYLARVQSPMFPVPPFGAGGSMAFRRAALEGIGGFDNALGTAALANEDTHAISEVLLAGWHGVYTPSAIAWHPHHRDDSDRRMQLAGYAQGLGAYYAALICRDPRRLFGLARLAPQALRHASGSGEEHGEPAGEPGPARPSMDTRGIVRGAGVYMRQRDWRRPRRVIP